MKVLQINNYHYLRGGSERVYFQTSEELENRGHEVIHFSTQNPKNLSSPTSKYFIKERSYLDKSTPAKLMSTFGFLYSKESAKNMEALILAERPDVAHLHIFFGQITSSILKVLKKHQVPVVMTVHEYKILCPVYTMKKIDGSICESCAGGNYLPCIKNKCNKGNLAYSALMAAESFYRDNFIPYEKYIDRFIFVSQFLYNKHVDYKKVYEKKGQVIYNSIDVSSIPEKEKKEKGNYFLYVGRLSREKGLHTLLKAMKNFPSIRLKIVGSGPEEENLKNLATKENLLNIDFEGYKSNEELDELYRKASFLFMPSEWYESFGMTILEGFCHGLPAAISNIGGMPELVQDNVNGFIFEPFNIESIISCIKRIKALNNNEYLKMSDSCLDTANQFSSTRYMDKIEGTYEQIIKMSKQ